MRQIEQATLEQIELAYRAGTKSVNAIAKAFALPEPTLRRMAKKNGWVRGAPEIKRRMVADHFAGVTKGLTNDEVRQSQEDAAGDDITDMERGLRVHRLCLAALQEAAETAKEPKEIKVIVDAASAAVAAIRKIRGLDTPTSEDSADIDAAIEAELERLYAQRQGAVPPEAESADEA